MCTDGLVSIQAGSEVLRIYASIASQLCIVCNILWFHGIPLNQQMQKMWLYFFQKLFGAEKQLFQFLRKKNKPTKLLNHSGPNKFCDAVGEFRISMQEVPGSKLGRADFFYAITSRKKKESGDTLAINIQTANRLALQVTLFQANSPDS